MKIVIICTALLALVGCTPIAKEDLFMKNQNDLTLQIQKFQFESNKLDAAWRHRVVDICVAKGYIPTVLNGNIDCKKL